MALDAATLALCATELKEKLPEARIDKIFQPTRDEVLLALRTRTQSHRLLLSARNGSARVCLTLESYENPAAPPSFCMLLRKHLTGARLLDVRTLPGERIVFFDFLCTNEMGDLVRNTLAAELMGRYCNLVLVAKGPAQAAQPGEDGKIIDALKRVDFEDSEVRQLLPGLGYTLPPRPNRLGFLEAPVAELETAVAASDASAVNTLKKVAGGVGPVVVREACFRAFAGQEKPGSALAAQELARLQTAIEQIRADFAAGGRPCLVTGEDGLPVEFSFTPLTQYQPGCTLAEYPSFSELLEGYYAKKDKAERLRQKSKELRKSLQNLYERAQRKQAARVEELAESEQSDHLRIAGELLTANLHAFAKGQKEASVLNWYTGRPETIALDVRLGPSANAQKYFKEYKKKQTAVKMLQTLLEQGEKEILYLETVLYELDAAEGEAAIGEIRAELKAQGYLKYYKQRDKKQKPADFIRYRSSDGFLILVGRNNLQNEKLTLKTARGKDLWFHTKNAPGSHVVVMSEGRDIPLPTQNEAAMLAVLHSSQKNSAKVPVDFTEVRNIRKTGDLPPGMVLYERYETGYITPEPEILQNLKEETP
ncbi:MAG: NFACT family protein [Oscillospiraceae bacterium]